MAIAGTTRSRALRGAIEPTCTPSFVTESQPLIAFVNHSVTGFDERRPPGPSRRSRRDRQVPTATRRRTRR